jgi:hypothetical protein
MHAYHRSLHQAYEACSVPPVYSFRQSLLGAVPEQSFNSRCLEKVNLSTTPDSYSKHVGPSTYTRTWASGASISAWASCIRRIVLQASVASAHRFPVGIGAYRYSPLGLDLETEITIPELVHLLDAQRNIVLPILRRQKAMPLDQGGDDQEGRAYGQGGLARR